MYGSRDKAGHYFSGARRSIDALYFAYFITRYYLGPSPVSLLPLPLPPPRAEGLGGRTSRSPWARLYELNRAREGEGAGEEDKGKREKRETSEGRMSENS